MRLRILLYSFSVLYLSGCATPYQKVGFRGGYEDMVLAEDMFQVNYRGNGYTSANRVQKFALRRAAELTMEKGFGYFVIVDSSADSNTFVMHQSNTYATANAYSYGNTAYGSGYANTTGSSIPVTKRGVNFMIKCFKEKPEGAPAIDARMFLESNFPSDHRAQ